MLAMAELYPIQTITKIDLLILRAKENLNFGQLSALNRYSTKYATLLNGLIEDREEKKWLSLCFQWSYERKL